MLPLIKILSVCLLMAAAVFPQRSTIDGVPVIGLEQKLGNQLPIEEMEYIDENGEKIAFKSLLDVPVVLSLVFYKCPGICTPLLNELSSVVEKSRLTAGKDYRLITISFDPTEGSDLSNLKQKNMLGAMERKPVAPENWRFFTGDSANIFKATDGVGFRYKKDTAAAGFIHSAALSFIGTDGKIYRYLEGTTFNPADFELAVIDATEGRARSFMRKIQRLCYSYKPESKSYILQVNRLILGVTLLFVIFFGAFLLFIKPKKK